MNLTSARSFIIVSLGRMNAIYNKPLFDEWILVKLGTEQGAILAYDGPRQDSYQKTFRTDIAVLRAEVEKRKLAIGDFEFTPEAHGRYFDGCVRLGQAGYLIFNNTTKTITEIRQDPLWIAAQRPLVELADRFREDPLE